MSYESDDDKIPSVRGWVTKQGGGKGGSKNWKKRWFQTTPRNPFKLDYYTNDSCSKLKGHIDMSEVTDMITTRNKDSKDNSYRYGFQLITEKRTWKLIVEGEKDGEYWKDSFRKLINQVRKNKGLPPLERKRHHKSSHHHHHHEKKEKKEKKKEEAPKEEEAPPPKEDFAPKPLAYSQPAPFRQPPPPPPQQGTIAPPPHSPRFSQSTTAASTSGRFNLAAPPPSGGFSLAAPPPTSSLKTQQPQVQAPLQEEEENEEEDYDENEIGEEENYDENAFEGEEYEDEEGEGEEEYDDEEEDIADDEIFDTDIRELAEGEKYAVALHDYEGQNETELTIQRGQKLIIFDDSDQDGWLGAETKNETRGWVSSHYVKILEN